MGSRYEIWLCRDTGERIVPLGDYLSQLEYVKKLNDVGWCTLTLGTILPEHYLVADRQIQVWRSPTPESQLSLDWIGLLTHWGKVRTSNNQLYTQLSGPDFNDLLQRRIVAYDADSSEAKATNIEVDDAMKAIVRENLGSLATASRDLSNYSITVQANQGLGTPITMGFAWQGVLKTLQKMNKQSRADGTEVFFHMVPIGFTNEFVPSIEFQTAVGQLGEDRTYPDAFEIVIFGEDWGNLISPTFASDYRQETNYIYAGGGGEGAEREIVEVEDTVRTGASIFGRRETFKDARNVPQGNTAQLTDRANEALTEGKAVQRFSGTLLDTQQSRYGLDWFWADKVSATAFGNQFDGIIRTVAVKVNPKGKETITAKVEQL